MACFITFEVANYKVDLSKESSVTVVVKKEFTDGSGDRMVTFDLATESNTANDGNVMLGLEGTVYANEPKSFTRTKLHVTMWDNETTKRITIPLVKGANVKANTAFIVRLSAPTWSSLGKNKTCTIQFIAAPVVTPPPEPTQRITPTPYVPPPIQPQVVAEPGVRRIAVTDPVTVLQGYYAADGKFVQTGVSIIYPQTGAAPGTSGYVGNIPAISSGTPPPIIQEPSAIIASETPQPLLLVAYIARILNTPKIHAANGWEAVPDSGTVYDGGWKFYAPEPLDVTGGWYSFGNTVYFPNNGWTVLFAEPEFRIEANAETLAVFKSMGATKFRLTYNGSTTRPFVLKDYSNNTLASGTLIYGQQEIEVPLAAVSPSATGIYLLSYTNPYGNPWYGNISKIELVP